MVVVAEDTTVSAVEFEAVLASAMDAVAGEASEIPAEVVKTDGGFASFNVEESFDGSFVVVCFACLR